MERASIFSVSRLRSSGLTFARPIAYSDRLTVRQPGGLVLPEATRACRKTTRAGSYQTSQLDWRWAKEAKFTKDYPRLR